MDEEWGKIDLHLDEYLKVHKISRSSLSRNGQIHYKQLLKYCKNDMKKLTCIYYLEYVKPSIVKLAIL